MELTSDNQAVLLQSRIITVIRGSQLQMLEWLGYKQVLRAHSDAQELDADKGYVHVCLCMCVCGVRGVQL